MLLAHFIQQFRQRFPDTVFSTVDDQCLIITAPNPEIGLLKIFEEFIEDHQITVAIGDITHGHFDGDTDMPDIDSICAEVLEFLGQVFTDRIEFYRIHYQGHPCGGGWRARQSGTNSAAEIAAGITWSGN